MSDVKVLDLAPNCAIIPPVTHTNTGRFLLSPMDVSNQIFAGQNAPYNWTNVPAVCVTPSASYAGRFAMSVLVVCKNCNNEFRVQNSRAKTAAYCSMACLVENNNETLICETCGKPFTALKRRRRNARYCSRACRYTGKEVPCSNCRKPVYRQRYALSRQWVFCSKACEGKFKTGLLVEDKHPNFITLDRVVDFTDEQKELTIGTVLGDASILKNSNGNAHLSVAHGGKQLPYLEYKQGLLTPHSRPISSYSRLDGRYNRTYTTCRFFTRCHPYLTHIRDIFYPDGKKKIPIQLLRDLTPRSFAFWYMDDGSKNRKGAGGLIATCAFEPSEIAAVCDLLHGLFGIICRPTKDNRIYLSAETWGTVQDLIRPYLIPEMEYKIT